MKSWIVAALAALFVCSCVAEARATEWKWTITPYAWATDIGADVSAGSRTFSKTITFAELLEDLDMAAQLRIETSRGRHGVLLDVFTAQLSQAGSRIAVPAGTGVPAGTEAVFDTEVGMTLIEAGGVFNLRTDRQGLSLLYGTRILRERAVVDAQLTVPQSTGRTERHETFESYVDAMAGARFTQALGRRLSLALRADVSAGGTEFTWSGSGEITYAFGERGRYGLTAGYRHMVINFDTDDTMEAGMTMSGIVSGVRIAF